MATTVTIPTLARPMDTMGRTGSRVACSLAQARGTTAGAILIGDAAGARADEGTTADADFTGAAGMAMAAATLEDGTEVASAEEPVGSMAEADFTEVGASTAAVEADSTVAVATLAVGMEAADIANAV